jgi:DNA polymerase III, epsilon subunit and related 3''-5'' exonucleases
MINMEEISVYAIDFEGSLQTGILEYGIVGFTPRDGIFFTETKLCKNRSAIPSNESSCHGLRAENLEPYEDFSQHLDTFLHLRKKALFCAHNAAFENRLLSDYCPIVPGAYTVFSTPSQQWGPWLDTWFLYRKYLKTQTCTVEQLIHFCNLSELLSQLGGKFCPLDRKNFHCALFDALACALLFLNFIRSEAGIGKNLLDLLQQSSPKASSENIKQQKWM